MERQEDTPQVPLIVARIQAPTVDLDEFVAQYCRYFGFDVVFLPTEGLQPPGRQVRFTFALADGTEVITGDGVVLRMRRDTGNPTRPPGMELRYQILDEASQALVDRMIELRTNGGARRPDPPPYVSMWFEHEVVTRNGYAGNPAGEAVAAPPLATAPTEKEMPAWALVAEPAPPRKPPAGALPANPFADVPVSALAYFVDWAVEHMTDSRRRWSSGAYAGMPLRAPRRGRRPFGALAAFTAGLATGGAVFLIGGALALRSGTLPSEPLGPGAAAAASSGFGIESGARAAPSPGVGGGPLVALPEAPTLPKAPLLPPTSTAPSLPRPKAPPASTMPSLPSVSTPAPSAPAPAPLHRHVDEPTTSSAHDAEPLAITSHPSGAQVRVDGRPRGHTPVTVEVAPGPHEVVLERPRYATSRVDARAPGPVHVELERPTATLQIESSPPGARVTVDGRALGTAPLALTTTGYERHRVQLELDGAVIRKRPYVKAPGDTLRVELSR